MMKYIILSLLMSLLLMMLSFFFSKKTFFDKEKMSPFECGFDPFSLTRTSFSIRFFKTALIFLIFDIEIVLILPIPLLIKYESKFLFYSSLLILLIIILGLYFEWQQKSLNWMN